MKRLAILLIPLALACVAAAAMTYSADRFIDPRYQGGRNTGNQYLDIEYLFANEVETYLEGTGVFPSISIRESTGATYYTKFQGGDQSANLTLTLPTAYAASNGYVLSSTTAGVLSWIANGGTWAGGAITNDGVLANGKYIETATSATNTGGIAAYNTSTSKYYPVFKATAGTAGGTMAAGIGDPNAVLTIASSGGLNVGATGAVTGVSTVAQSGDTTFANGKGIKSSTTTGQTVGVYAYDVDGAAYSPGVLGTNGNAPSWTFGYATGTTTLASSDWGIDATGTATGIASVQFDSGTTIYCANVTVSNAEIKTLFSAPKVLVAAPGTHNVIDVVSVVLFYDYASAAFNTAANNLTVEYKSDASGPTATSAISQTGFLDQTVDGVGKLLPVAVANQVVAAIENQPVVLYCATADPTTGGGVLRVAISYRIMPTGF